MQKNREQEVPVDADVVDYIHGWDDVLSGLEGIFTKMGHVFTDMVGRMESAGKDGTWNVLTDRNGTNRHKPLARDMK